MESIYSKMSEDPVVSGLVIAAIIAVLGWLLQWLWIYAAKRGKFIREERVAKRRRRYHKVIDGKEFVMWRDRVLKHIYGEKYFTEEFGCEFPVYSLECAEPLPYRFQEFYSKKDIPFHLYLVDNGELIESSLDHQEMVYPDKRQIRKFLKLVVKLKYPNLLGFTLDRFDMTPDGKITHVYPKLGKYVRTVCSSLILEYEMYEAYRKCRGTAAIGSDVWKYLPLRARIHDGHTVEDVLFTGLNRYSLLSVQAFIMFFDPHAGEKGEWVTLIAERSEKVTSKACYLQFLPAGGFELFDGEGNCKEDIIRDNYSLRKAFFREYLEEVFDKPEFGQAPQGDFGPLSKIMNDENTRTITDLIGKGKAHFELMGSAVDLVNLRHDLAFILRIDDENFHKNIFSFNDEFAAGKIRQRMLLRELDEKLQGNYKICQASVGLYNMAKKNRLYLDLKAKGFSYP